jgi:hypothetical protein
LRGWVRQKGGVGKLAGLMVWLAGELLILLVICSLGPGSLVVRRLRWTPLEKLCGAFGASFALTYLAGFALFCVNAPAWGYWCVTAIFLGMGVAAAGQWKVWLGRKQTRSALLALVAVLAWEFMHLAMVRNYDGGAWGGDWIEHYQRTLIFMHELPVRGVIMGTYILPARPPMMNVMAAFYMRQTGGDSFEAFSLIFLFLNGWAVLACCLLLRLFARRWIRCVPALVVLFMLNPSIVENATLTVTKAFAAGLAVLGVAFYVRWLQRGGRSRLVAAGASLAAGILVHYSACGFALAVALHFAISRRARLADWAAVSGVGVLLLAGWFIWSCEIFGAKGTFLSNTTVTFSAPQSPAKNIEKVAYNCFTSIVPLSIRQVGWNVAALKNWGEVRDYYFLMTQQTLPTMIGIAGGCVVLLLLARRLSRRGAQRGFWIFYILFGFLVGIAVNGEWQLAGDAHVTLQSMGMMGVTFLAASLPELSTWLFGLVVGGCALDYALGVLLQFDRESYVYPTLRQPDGTLAFLKDPTLGTYGFSEYVAKTMDGYTFWGDHCAAASTFLELASAGIAVGAMVWLVRWRKRVASNRSANL